MQNFSNPSEILDRSPWGVWLFMIKTTLADMSMESINR
jgi:hypothetical protein